MHTLNLCHCGRVLRPGRINNNEPYSVIVVVPAICIKALHVLNMQKQAQKPIDLPRSNGVCGEVEIELLSPASVLVLGVVMGCLLGFDR